MFVKSRTVNFYTKDQCPLCIEGLEIVRDLADDYHFEINVIDIYQNDQLLEKYQLMIPVVKVDDRIIDYGNISWSKLNEYFKTANK